MNSRISPSFPIHLYLFSISLIITFSFPPSSSFNIDWYRACSNKFNCGNITNVGFPFWGGFRQYGCGIPSLMLLCFENITTIIELMDVKYLVLEFNQISQTLRIARSDYTDDLCPEKFINTTLDYNLFDSNPNPNHGYINITLLYCAFPKDGSPGQFSCPEYEFGSIIVGDIGPGICNESVIIPVSYSGVNGVVNSSEILGAIKEGFEVKWKNDTGCGDCEESKGVCGFDLGLNSTTCYCYGYSSGLRICPSLPEDGAPTIPSESNVRLKGLSKTKNVRLKAVIGMVK